MYESSALFESGLTFSLTNFEHAVTHLERAREKINHHLRSDDQVCRQKSWIEFLFLFLFIVHFLCLQTYKHEEKKYLLEHLTHFLSSKTFFQILAVNSITFKK